MSALTWNVDVELRVLEAHRHVGPLQDEPVAAASLSAEVELDDGAARGKALPVGPPPHPPARISDARATGQYWPYRYMARTSPETLGSSVR